MYLYQVCIKYKTNKIPAKIQIISYEQILFNLSDLLLLYCYMLQLNQQKIAIYK